MEFQPLAGVAGAVGHVGGVGLVGVRSEGVEVLLAHAAERRRIALAGALAGHAADLEILQPVGVAPDAQRAVAAAPWRRQADPLEGIIVHDVNED